MAKILHLATELIVAITSNIPRSSDEPHVVLVNRKMHHMIAQELYKHIVLGQSGDPSNRGGSKWIHEDPCWDTVRLLRFSGMPKTTPWSHKPVVVALDLGLDSNTLHESLGCSALMLHLPSLKRLCLSSKRPAGREPGQTHTLFCHLPRQDEDRRVCERNTREPRHRHRSKRRPS